MLYSEATASLAREKDEPEEGRSGDGAVAPARVGAEKSMVANSSELLAGAPQREQKRATSGT
jgi:hypothetical protein